MAAPIGYLGASILYPEPLVSALPRFTTSPEQVLPPAAKLACWEVTSWDHTVDSVIKHTLSAKVIYDCAANHPEAVLTETKGFNMPFYLPLAVSPGELPFFNARAYVELSESAISDTEEDLVAGMLYLPDSAAGTGYYVGAWQPAEPSDASGPTGIIVGLYGSAPTSVRASVGRLHFNPIEPAIEDSDTALMGEEPELISE